MEKETTTTTTKKRELLEFHSPAAERAAARGEETKTIVITKRYAKDYFRNICINDNPACVLPTNKPVEVSVDEYHELMNSMAVREQAENESLKLEKEFKARSKYFN